MRVSAAAPSPGRDPPPGYNGLPARLGLLESGGGLRRPPPYGVGTIRPAGPRAGSQLSPPGPLSTARSRLLVTLLGLPQGPLPGPPSPLLPSRPGKPQRGLALLGEELRAAPVAEELEARPGQGPCEQARRLWLGG